MDAKKTPFQQIEDSLNEKASKKEVALAIKAVLDVVKELKKLIKDEQSSGDGELRREFMATISASEKNLKAIIQKSDSLALDQVYKFINAETYKLEEQIKNIEKYDSSLLETKWATVIEDLHQRIENIRPFVLVPTEVRDSLESITEEDEKLRFSAIKGGDELVKKVKSIEIRPFQGGGGLRGVDLSVNGSSVGQAQYINLIAGSNITLTLTQVGQRQDILIDASGGSGSFAKLTATGTVDGINKDFTFTSAPSIIIVDGRPMQKTSSDGTANWTGTTSVSLTIAPNSDIYGF